MENVEILIENARSRENKAILYKIIELKEPIIRKILNGEKITPQEQGYLLAIEDMESFCSARE